MTGGELLNSLQKFVSDPLQHEAIWRHQGKHIAVHAELERAYPGSKLLGRKFLLEAGETVAPEAVHVER
jgi:hypothetical protein